MLDTVFCNKYKEYLLDTKVSARGKVMVNKPISRNTASAYWNIFKQVLTKAYRERRLVDNIASLLDNIPCTIPVKPFTGGSQKTIQLRMFSSSSKKSRYIFLFEWITYK